MEISGYVFCCLIYWFAGFTQGVSGFGSALVALPLLTLFLDIKEAVPLCSLMGILITLSLGWNMRRHLELKKILQLCIGCIPGIVVGVLLLKQLPETAVRTLLGVLLLGYSAYSLLADPKARALHWMWAYVASFFTGAIGAAFSAGGPPVIIYTALSGWSKNTVKATLTGFFMFVGPLIAIAHAVSGLTTMHVLRVGAVVAPGVLLGVWCGILLYGRLSEQAYRRVLYLLLAVLGAYMLVDSLF